MYDSLYHHQKVKRDEHYQQMGNKENFSCSRGIEMEATFYSGQGKACIFLFVYLFIYQGNNNSKELR